MPSALQTSLRNSKLWWRIRLGKSPFPLSSKTVQLPALWLDTMRLAGVFLGVLVITGILLSLNYEPSARPQYQQNKPLAMARALQTVVVNSDTICMANEMLLLPIRSADSVEFPADKLSNIQIMRDEQGQILTVSAATASVERGIMQQIPFGAIIRGIHILSVHCFIGCLVVAFVVVFFRRGYRAPFELVWFQTLGIIAVALFSAFSGHVLPWNILGYVSAQIVLSAVSYIPLGETFAAIIRGGTILGPATLPRMFIVHILISPIIIIWMFRSVVRLAHKLSTDTPPSQFSYISRLVVAVVILAVGASVFVPFGNYAERLPADVSKAISGAATLRPSWYFLPGFQILRVFPMDLAALFMVIWCGFWILLPFVGVGSKHKRITMWVSGALLLILAFGFGISGLLR
ncbi:MAG: cytochrome b N-terminal domain-containing protein [Bacteroidetes bacterium]|nr:cytochrome b N-terminal domain-containing protein [Bacteroidota bacterium]